MNDLNSWMCIFLSVIVIAIYKIIRYVIYCIAMVRTIKQVGSMTDRDRDKLLSIIDKTVDKVNNK